VHACENACREVGGFARKARCWALIVAFDSATAVPQRLRDTSPLSRQALSASRTLLVRPGRSQFDPSSRSARTGRTMFVQHQRRAHPTRSLSNLCCWPGRSYARRQAAARPGQKPRFLPLETKLMSEKTPGRAGRRRLFSNELRVRRFPRRRSVRPLCLLRAARRSGAQALADRCPVDMCFVRR